MSFCWFSQMREWESDLLLRETQLAHLEADLRKRENRLGVVSTCTVREAGPQDYTATHAFTQDMSAQIYSEPGAATAVPEVLSKVVVRDENGVYGGGNSHFSGDGHCSGGADTVLDMLGVTRIFEKEKLALLQAFPGYATQYPHSIVAV
jgi:hypothetical protein